MIIQAVENKLDTLNNKVKANGGHFYYVGGYVRDQLLKRTTKDIDFLVAGISKDTFEKILSDLFQVNFVGKSFGVYKINYEDKEIDITFPRKEFSTGDGHKDFTVIADENITLEEDLQRRDFTINAMAMEYDTGKIIDPCNGQKDIRSKTIKQITTNSIQEDYLRALRAIQFASRFNFHIDKETFFNIAKHKELIDTISEERIRVELEKLLKSNSIVQGFNYLLRTGLLAKILPEIEAMNTDEYNYIYHCYNTYYHTLHALEEYNLSCRDESKEPDLELCLGILLHDTGKPHTTSVDEFGVFHNYDHEYKGTEVAEEVLKRLRYDNDTINNVKHLVLHHMQTSDKITRRNIRRMMSNLGYELTDKVYTMVYFDKLLTAHKMMKEERLEIHTIMDEIKVQNDALKITDLEVDGYDLMALGYNGRDIGIALKRLLDIVIDEPAKNTKETLLSELEKLKEGGSCYARVSL